MSVVSNRRRITETREKLQTLRSQGFRYIITDDDGETWVGSRQQPGLEIDQLINHCFLGRITVAR